MEHAKHDDQHFLSVRVNIGSIRVISESSKYSEDTTWFLTLNIFNLLNNRGCSPSANSLSSASIHDSASRESS